MPNTSVNCSSREESFSTDSEDPYSPSSREEETGADSKGVHENCHEGGGSLTHSAMSTQVSGNIQLNFFMSCHSV